jgi:TonB-linked SusC/RagA family outer membrane protein
MKKLLILTLLSALAGIFTLSAQTVVITGTVTSSVQGEGPIPGVAVVAKGTTVGAMTDSQGKYSLAVPVGTKTLTFSFVGMKNVDVNIGNRTVIDVVMEPDLVGLNEVVVTALGISREKKALGYSVQAVPNDVIEKTANPDLAGALQGKLAGVDIKPSSGMPGASSQIVIRGARSFTGNNTPLYIVDGMPIASTADFSTGNSVTGADIADRSIDIDPSDIESIDILKGQAAAALYGIRASNGVVIITTKSGKGNPEGKPVVSFSHTSAFSDVSRIPDYQTTYAQGSYGKYVSNTSFSWGPKITDLPDDPTYGGNANGHPGQYLVPQLQKAEYDNPWVTPAVYNGWKDFFRTGYSMTNNLSVSQAGQSGSYILGVSQTSQSGIAPSTGMNRYNAKASAQRNLNKNFNAGFNTNFSRTDIDKLPSANDAALNGAYAAPISYDLKDWPYAVPGDPYTQIYFRSLTFDNPYWAAAHNVFNEKTDRFFGSGYVNYMAALNSTMNLKVKYQLGLDSYTTHFQDIFEYGHRGSTGIIDNYGITNITFNSLLTVNYDWTIAQDFTVNAILGNEFNQENSKTYTEHGEDFNFGGWAHIQNANTVTANESKDRFRTVGTFGSLSLGWKSALFLNATGRNDIVSQMPRGHRSFFYPSVSFSWVATELGPLRNSNWFSFGKFRFSFAEVGQAGRYLLNYYTKPNYGGGFWDGEPVSYPIAGINSYIPNSIQYDPNLVPQNTKSFELGAELKFFKNRVGIDYTFSRQNIINQIFAVPLAGSTGASQLVTNGGKVHTVSHEVVVDLIPVAAKTFNWDINVNFSKVTNLVDELAPGVESIFLGGFVTPQVRASIGTTYPVIYGTSYVHDAATGKIVVEDSPGAWNNGMPKTGEPGIIGIVSPNFILGGTNTFTYRDLSLTATVEWKSGGEMYSGSNGLLYLYGVAAKTGDRESTFIFDGVKPDGTPNDIVRGGPNDPDALQDLYTNVLTNIDEFYIYDNSFVKLRELALRYNPSNKVFGKVKLTVTAFARNFLIWSALPNFDPESTQGNTNMGGSFERFSMPQTHSYGLSLDLTF